MSDYNYRKEISGATTYTEGSDVNCHSAFISATGSFIPAPTFIGQSFFCETTAELISTGSATIHIKGTLKAKKVTLTAKSSGKIIIGRLECDELVVEIVDSATVTIESGLTVAQASGTVKGASTGVCRAPITRDEVMAYDSSTWDTQQ